MNKILPFSLIFVFLFSCGDSSQRIVQSTNSKEKIRSVDFEKVKVTKGFWSEYLQRNHKITIRHNLKKCVKTGRINNFLIAAGEIEGNYSGHHTSADSDVFKTLEGIANSISIYPDPELEVEMDRIVAVIGKAQDADGYLYTPRSIEPDSPPKQAGKERWGYLTDSHELYNVGHMYEAAVAYFKATGKSDFLDIALKNADLLCATFGPNKKHEIPGHQEIEIGLVKLYEVTKDRKYLELAYFFLDQRGRHDNGRPIYTYNDEDFQLQDHIPVLEQTIAKGHAVRLGYQAVAMSDIATLTNNQGYFNTLEALWEDVVGKKMYLTGAIGSRKYGESFGAPYYLPNQSSYAETCGSIANMLWQYRMFLESGEAYYIDVLERVVYNGILSSPSLMGNDFFYANPMASDGQRHRKAWYDVPCCPTNIGRTIPTLPGYAYATEGNAIYVNLFMDSKSTFLLTGGNEVSISQETQYPDNGNIKIELKSKLDTKYQLRLRIPGWALGTAVPGSLYTYLDDSPADIRLLVNGENVPLKIVKGYAIVELGSNNNDVVYLEIPMNVKKVVSHPEIIENKGKVALERGPLVYCFEGEDNEEVVSEIILNSDTNFKSTYRKNLMGGTIVLEKGNIKAIPYNKWGNRRDKSMSVWVNLGQ